MEEEKECKEVVKVGKWEEEKGCREADDLREMVELAKRKAQEAEESTRAVEAEARMVIAAARERDRERVRQKE